MSSSQEHNTPQPRSEPYPPQGMYPPQPEAVPYPYPPQAPYPYPPQGAYPSPLEAGSYPYPPQAPYPYPPQGAYVPTGQKIQNKRANRAMIYGFISIFLAAITLLQQVGAAGVITGTFAIIYGFTSLKIARKLPGNVGRGQAITGIVLGFVAWFLVIISLIIRSTTGS